MITEVFDGPFRIVVPSGLVPQPRWEEGVMTPLLIGFTLLTVLRAAKE
jgi:hypothetical protein